MKSSIKNLDQFQVVGFIISGVVSIVLLIATHETVQSLILGFVLAALIQGFDIQMRVKDSEERLLEVNVLSHEILQDESILVSL